MAQTAADPAATARKALDLLLAGKYSELFQMFSADMQKAYPGSFAGEAAGRSSAR